jgi:hypothetical protein
MTNKIAGCAASHDDNANVSVARESVQRLGERVAHLLVEIDALCAAQCNDRNSTGYSCRQNIGVHRVLLSAKNQNCRHLLTGAYAHITGAIDRSAQYVYIGCIITFL